MKRTLALVCALVLCACGARAQTRGSLVMPVFDRNAATLPPVTDNYWTDYIRAGMRAQYDMDVSYIAVPRATSIDRYNALILAGNAPDVIMEYDYPTLVSFAGAGALQEIDVAQLKARAPTFYENTKHLLPYGQLNGRQMFIFATRPQTHNFGYFIRKDWLDAAGLAMPRTQEDYVNVLRAFRDLAPAGGQTVPMTVSLPAPNTFLDYPFRPWPYPEQELAMYSDLTIAPLTSDSYREMLRWYNGLYAQGLISPEFALDIDGSRARADFMAGRAGVYAFYLQKEPPVIQTLKQNVPTSDIAVLNTAALCADGAKPVEYRYAGYGMIMGVSASCEHPEYVYDYLEWMSAQEHLFTLQNGFEGTHYTMDADGLPAALEYGGAERMNYGSNKDLWCVVTEGKAAPDDSAEARLKMEATNAPPGYEYLVYDLYENFKTNVEPYYYADYAFSEALTACNQYAETLRAKFQQYAVELIMCAPDAFDALYERYCADYLDSGYREVLAQRRAAYDAARAEKQESP